MTGANRTKMTVYVAALFLAGGICGAMVMKRFVLTPQSLKLGRSEEIAGKIRVKLGTGLGLTPAQLDKYQPLITQTAHELEASHQDCLDRISVALDKLHAAIAPELSQEQKAKMQALETDRAAAMLQKYNYQPGRTNR